MRAAPDGTGRTEPYQVRSPLGGAQGPSRPTVERSDPRYWNLHDFPAPAEGQQWTEARFEQIAAIEARKAEAAERRRERPHERSRPQQATPHVFAELIPAKPYCCDYPEHGLKIRAHAAALKRRHIQFNGPNAFSWMLHDIDRSDAYFAHKDAYLPPPNVIALNPENGHGHSAILLATPVARHSASRIAPLRFFSDIERGFARRLGADRRYTGLVAKNPLHGDWRVEWRREEPYTLAELADWLFKGDLAPDINPETTLGAGRNCTVFEELRRIAYREVRAFKGNGGLEAFRARLERVAIGINLQFPMALGITEIRAIAKSVANWTWRHFSTERFSAIQSHRAKARTRRNLAIVEEIKNGSA
jgi:hypothetical protein